MLTKKKCWHVKIKSYYYYFFFARPCICSPVSPQRQEQGTHREGHRRVMWFWRLIWSYTKTSRAGKKTTSITIATPPGNPRLSPRWIWVLISPTVSWGVGVPHWETLAGVRDDYSPDVIYLCAQSVGIGGTLLHYSSDLGVQCVCVCVSRGK